MRRTEAFPSPRRSGDHDASGNDASVPSQRVDAVDDRTVTAMLEQLQEGYVAAVAATAGCFVQRVGGDVNGVDAHIIRPAKSIGAEEEITLGVQLKCTTQVRPDPAKEYFSYQFSKRRSLEALTLRRSIIKVIPLIMVTSPQQRSWTKSTHEALRISHCCYWLNLEGYSITDGVQKPSVKIPTANIFDADALIDIMGRLERGEDL
ncbi:DUF4365 domain-containing protein [Actinoplanes sp. TBRC 11911]|uniref:DUF4365 domain-containing protein n=1 Tax=Actinoplanes sp. TBRC 11911 TaxID=2729386 RepID=UPI00145D0C9A|nr:DUF4365 domain-containing protein [Actinoplanes sp. TBRC 11911]NMO54497.1 DUF4365 domain-containing protein [Actinoplanes sp. TBRC 11911]